MDALETGADLPGAHDRVLVTDRTPDVPLKTSDVYLEHVLTVVATQRGQDVEALEDEMRSATVHTLPRKRRDAGA